MRLQTITSWLASDFDAQIAKVLFRLGVEDHPDDPDAGAVAALELGLSDGETVQIDPETGEVILRTERSQILRNIEIAATRDDLSISELVASGEIRRADLRDEPQ